jgi:site-specific recombinase XerD
MNELVPVTSHVPALIRAAGDRAQTRFWEFFVSNIRNPHTRRAHARAALEFFDWLRAKGVTQIADIESVHVAAYIEQLQKAFSGSRSSFRQAILQTARQA